MNKHALNILQYKDIMNKVSSYSLNEHNMSLIKNHMPYTDKFEIIDAQKETTEGVFYLLNSQGVPHDIFYDITEGLKRAKIGAIMSASELYGVGRLLKVSQRAKRSIDNFKYKENIEILLSITSDIKLCYDCSQEIFASIDQDGAVLDSASPKLAGIRRKIKSTQDSIRNKIDSYLRDSKYEQVLQDNIVTKRNDRFVIPIKQQFKGEIKGIVHDMSGSGQTLFIEPMAVVEANNQVAQLVAEEQDEIARILASLTDLVALKYEDILENLECLYRLDFIFAKAQYSIEIKGNSPRIVNERSINIVKGRHPLLDKDTCVPISIRLDNNNHIIVITGPNTGGKTVTLKTAGLFIAMSQAGLHLPAAAGTQLSVFDDICADIGDEQSIEQSLSTFSSHMTNIVSIFKEIETEPDKRYFVLLDELGAGTDPVEGAALAMSILERLKILNIAAMVTTHYSELKVYAMTSENIMNASMEFSVETLAPTYRLLMGTPGKSNAFLISKKLGLDDDIIKKANSFIGNDTQKIEDMLTIIERNKRESDRLYKSAEEKYRKAKETELQAENRIKNIEAKKQKEIDKAKTEAREIVNDAKKEMDALIKELNQLKNSNTNIDKTLTETRTKLRKAEREYKEKIVVNTKTHKVTDIVVGQSVLVKSLGQNGIVLSLPDKQGVLSVQMGIMKINVKVDDLAKSDEKNVIVPKETKRTSKLRQKTVSMRLDVRGKDSISAVEDVERYIDEAFLDHLEEATIVHGKGTGVLKQAIHDALKHNKQIKSFRLGKYGEGESGVTIIKFKK